jgi:hypothetical protein
LLFRFSFWFSFSQYWFVRHPTLAVGIYISIPIAFNWWVSFFTISITSYYYYWSYSTTYYILENHFIIYTKMHIINHLKSLDVLYSSGFWRATPNLSLLQSIIIAIETLLGFEEKVRHNCHDVGLRLLLLFSLLLIILLPPLSFLIRRRLQFSCSSSWRWYCII